MLNWFRRRPRCPIDPTTRGWINRRWKWLIDEFGQDLMRKSATVLPTPEFFPDAYRGTEMDVRRLVGRACGYMRVDPDRVDIDFYDERDRPPFVDDQGRAIAGTAGLFGNGHRYEISLNRDQFHDPMLLVGTVAHELAHARTLGEGRCFQDEYDNELLTDLTVVFHGLGLFLANVPRHWDSATTTWPGTDVPKPEYMTTPMFGYALALRCWLRREPMPAWRRRLRPGVRSEFTTSLRFLQGMDPDRPD